MGNLFRCGGGSGTKVYYLGKGTTFDIKQLLPNVDCTKLTEDNFIVGICDLSNRNTTTVTGNTSYYYRASVDNPNILSTSFDVDTGILTISNYKQSLYVQKCQTSQVSSGNWSTENSTRVNLEHTCFAYLVIGEIEDVSTT